MRQRVRTLGITKCPTGMSLKGRRCTYRGVGRSVNTRGIDIAFGDLIYDGLDKSSPILVYIKVARSGA